MKKQLLILSLLFINLLTAQSVDEIVANYLENIGGEEKLSQINSLKMEGKAIQQGLEIPVEMIMTKKGKQYITAEIQGKKLVQLAFDGETAWRTNFMNMQSEKMDDESIENLKVNAKNEFPVPFLNYKEKGFKVELVGKEEIEGVQTFKVKLTEGHVKMDGEEVPKVVFYYFDVDNFIPIVAEEEIKKGQFKGTKIQQVFSDYQEVDGVYFPFSIVQKFKGVTGSEMKISKIEINPEIDENIFKFIPPEQKNKQ